MAVTPYKTWATGEILTASDLNSSFTQITNNGEDLGWPATQAKDLNGQALILDADADSQVVEISDDIIGLQLAGVASIIKFDGATAGGALVNGFTFQPEVTTSGPLLKVHGTDTNVDFNIAGQAAGKVAIVDGADNTKRALWDVSAITTATDRTITMPDADVDLSAIGSGLSNVVEDTTPQLGGNLDLNAFGITFSEIFNVALDTDISSGNVIVLKGAAAGEMTAASGTQNFITVQPHVNQSGTGGYYALLVDVTETGTGSGVAKLIDLQVGSSTKFNIDNDGQINAQGKLAMADNVIERPKLLDIGETVNAIGSIGGGTQDIDLTLGNVVSGTVDTSTTTFTFSNPSASGTSCTFTLILTNGGSQTVNWPAAVDWAGGTAPTLTAAGVDILTFTTIDGGTIWYGFAAGLDMQ